jgi:hypothetical protein
MPPDMITPPNSPMLSTTPVSDPPLLVSPEDPGDIPDPPVPPGAVAKTPIKPKAKPQAPDETAALPERFGEHEALVQAFAQHVLTHVDTALADSQRHADKAVHDLYDYVRSLIETDKERLRHAETLLDTLMAKALAEGLTLRSTPTQQLTIQTMSPQGFPVHFHLSKASIGELIAEIPLATDWLAQHGYKPVV